MWLQITATILVALFGLNIEALTPQEAAQFTTAGGCTPDAGYEGAKLSASFQNGVTTIKANHIPNHKWEWVNPNSPSAGTVQTYTFNTPSYQPDNNVTCLSMGPIGIAKNGVFIFNPTTAEGANAKTSETMDSYGGHTAPFGEYHYHSLPDNEQVWDSSNPDSQFIGIAMDGYPLYSIGSDIDVNSLDICHGLSIGGQYRYIASPDHFPYFLGCYRGIKQIKGRGPPLRSGQPSETSCAGMKPGQACTCEFGIIEYSKKRILALLEELLDEKRQNTEGICGGKNSSSAGSGQPPQFGGSNFNSGYPVQQQPQYGGYSGSVGGNGGYQTQQQTQYGGGLFPQWGYSGYNYGNGWYGQGWRRPPYFRRPPVRYTGYGSWWGRGRYGKK